MASSLGMVMARRAAMAAALACAAALPAAAQRAEPCIGASWEMTGPLANNGGMLRITVETALETINAAGGVLGKPLRLVIYDDVGEPARAVDNARRIGERDNCIIMMGGGRTPNAIALREPLAEMGMPWIGPISAGTTVIEHQNGRNEWMFRVSMKDRWVTGYLVDQAKLRSPTGKIGFVYEGTAWGQGALPDVEAAAKRAGVTLAGRETWNIGDQDMSAQMIRLRDAGVDTIILWGVDRESANMLRSMDRIGYKPKIVSAWGLTTAFAKAVGPLAEGVMVAGTFNWNGQLSPAAQGAFDAMKAKFPDRIRTTADLEIPSGMANAWDATFIIAEAIKLAGAYDRTKLRDAMFRVNYEGLVANYRPAFIKGNQERMDAVLPEAYKMQAFHNGVLMPIEATPYGMRN
ncbi:ABC transporter substrate-binding protein [Paracraurococcus lichenis]|uniref:ABC transporter substrate-binding protein n=1 Tax=Paracraurococcus lichenis TaxID=3064888 RepID=A0ABT9E2T9_9PROT|nr:ABC transporter substrate-binding protein [Paracraurococcus sp. LOR1-02]MDO9710412.1 ABC transporter substrate-binding protein [Paracraurococcus sp. LOR1-02]